jgi:hypothetical protein
MPPPPNTFVPGAFDSGIREGRSFDPQSAHKLFMVLMKPPL